MEDREKVGLRIEHGIEALENSLLITFHQLGIDEFLVSKLDELSKAILKLTCKYFSKVIERRFYTDLLYEYGERGLFEKLKVFEELFWAIRTLDLLLYFADRIKGDNKILTAIMETACKKGDVKMMKQLHEWGCTAYSAQNIAASGNVEAMKLLISWSTHNSTDDNNTLPKFPCEEEESYHIIDTAIQYHNTSMVKFLLDIGFAPTSANVSTALDASNVPVLKMLREKGCTLSLNEEFGRMWRGSSKSFDLELAKFILDWNNEVVDEYIFNEAIKTGNIELITFLKENYNVPESTEYILNAPRRNKENALEIVKLLLEWNFPWTKSIETFRKIVSKNIPEMAQLFYDLGCPVDSSCVEHASIELLELLHSWGVKLPPTLMTKAIHDMKIEVVEKLHAWGVGFEPNGRSFEGAFIRRYDNMNIDAYYFSGPATINPSAMARLLHEWGCPLVLLLSFILDTFTACHLYKCSDWIS